MTLLYNRYKSNSFPPIVGKRKKGVLHKQKKKKNTHGRRVNLGEQWH